MMLSHMLGCIRQPLLAAVAAALLTLGMAGASAPAFAQDASSSAAPADTTTVASDDPASKDADAVARGFKAWRQSDCSACHGWAGNGERVGENPAGPSLRATQLAPRDIKETFMCGRPATSMPYHDRLAYTDTRCYGMTAADVGASMPIKGKTLTDDQANDILAYMEAKILGKPDKPTLEECQDYFGKKPVCNAYQ